MSIGAQVNLISMQLQMILEVIRQETLNLMVSGKTPGMAGSEDARYFQKLEAWKHRLEGLNKQLTQLLNRVESQRGWADSSSRRLAPDQRREMMRRSAQSLDDQAAHVIRAQNKAREVARELEALFWRSVNPTAADIWRRTVEHINDVMEFRKELQELEMAMNRGETAHLLNAQDRAGLRTAIAEIRGQQYIMARAGSPSPDYIGLATLLITLLHSLWVYRSRQGRR